MIARRGKRRSGAVLHIAAALWASGLQVISGTEPLKEFIYDTAPFPSAHASTIVELKSGDLMAAWFGGTKEGAPDVAIWAATRHANRWSAPVELAREPNIAAFNPVHFHSSF